LSFGDDYPLPAVIRVDEYREYKPVMARRSEEEAAETANAVLINKILQTFGADDDILEKNVEFHAKSNWLDVKATVTVSENVGQDRLRYSHDAPTQ
jgi:hypothetical protein